MSAEPGLGQADARNEKFQILEPSSVASQGRHEQETGLEMEAGLKPGSTTWDVSVPHGGLNHYAIMPSPNMEK